MKPLPAIITLFSFSWCGLNASVEVRKPTREDLDSIIEMDRRVSLEFFVPLFQYYYDSFQVAKNPTEKLLADVEDDKALLLEIIEETDSSQTCLIAWDTDQNQCVGLIVFSRYENGTEVGCEDTGPAVEIDLLLVDEAYRGKKIGQSLVGQALATFDGCIQAVVSPFKENNERTRKFYEKCGFIEKGKPHGTNSWGVERALVYCRYEWKKPQHEPLLNQPTKSIPGIPVQPTKRELKRQGRFQ